MALVLKNMMSIYQETKLVRLYGFDSNVEQLVPVGPYFFMKLASGQIIGCGVNQQVHFLEHE